MFGRINIYTQLKYLVAFLVESLDEPWIVRTPELAKVSIADLDYCLLMPHKLVRGDLLFPCYIQL